MNNSILLEQTELSPLTSPLMHRLSVEGLQMSVYIGCEPEERARKQPVEVDIDLFFKEAPFGCQSDVLSDTVCYAQCSEKILRHCEEKEFHLIERLAFEIYEVLQGDLPQGSFITISVRKLRPYLHYVKGVRFIYSATTQ